MDIDNILKSGDVLRFHSVHGITKQKLSEHQWGVAMLLCKFFPVCSKEVLFYALTHDCSELYTGDIPATAKWANPLLKELLDDLEDEANEDLGLAKRYIGLMPEDMRRVKLCDCLEGMRYCIDRYLHGELGAIIPFRKWQHYLETNMQDMLKGSVEEYFRKLTRYAIDSVKTNQVQSIMREDAIAQNKRNQENGSK